MHAQNLEATMRGLQAGVEGTPEGQHQAALLTTNDGIHRYELEQNGDLQPLEVTTAQSDLEEGVETTPKSYPDQAAVLNNLGLRLTSRNDLMGGQHAQDLAAAHAIAQLEGAVEAMSVLSEDQPARAALLGSLGKCLGRRYCRTGNLQDLEAAIAHLGAAVEATPEGHHDRAGWLSSLGINLGRRYKRTGNLQDLQAAITKSEAAVEATPEDHPDRAERLANLGINFRSRYERTGNLQDLETAITKSEAAVEATPEDNPDRAIYLHNLGMHLSSRYEQTGNLQDLETAITQLEAAVEAMPKDRYHPDRAERLANLGINLDTRYKRTGNLQDLEAAITKSEAAVEATPEDHPARARHLIHLGNRFRSRYERTGQLQDLEAAITRSEAAVEATPEDHPARAIYLHNLGMHLSSRYERTGNLQDLETAITKLKAAVEATPEDHIDRATSLSSLAGSLARRYIETGNLDDLDAAITQSEAALKATPEGHPARAGWLTNLGCHLSSRYERTGNLQDLEVAIARSEAALEATPEDHPDQAALLYNLGCNLGRLYERTGNLQDLQAAITRSEAAVEATPEDHPERAKRLANLGCRLGIRYDQTGSVQDLEASIARSEAACALVEATPPREDHLGHDHADRLVYLGMHFTGRSEQTGDLQDLDAAITNLKAAVEATPKDHIGRARLLNTLGGQLMERYKRTRNVKDLEAAIDTWFNSWNARTAPILERLTAALTVANTWVSMYNVSPSAIDLSRACSLLDAATHLMSLATPRSLEREDQQHILARLTGLASLAAAVALETGKSALEALQVQELGRSITNGQLIDYRSDILNLIEQHPVLANDFDSLRQELDSQFPSTESFISTSIENRLLLQQAAVHRRNKAATELDDILEQIRQKPGFENFLRAASEESLLLAAEEGPIVVLNVTELRSDAMILTKTQVRSIALPYLSHDLMIKYFGSNTAINDNKFQRELLEWLWKGAVQPVLHELGFYPGPKGVDPHATRPLPRIWWIGVGLMAKAPIHAAAKFKKGRIQMTTLHYCLSSYTSTIKALQYSQSRERQQLHNASMLIVTMPTTPGESSLSGVTKESDEIKQHFSTVDTLECPTAEHVLQILSGYNIAHFACHGVSSINPAESHLLLVKESTSDDGDGSCAGTEEVDKLRVKDIAALKLPAARLAYLSACSTANSTSSELIDEVTHIASSFHIAGFTHVIGTLWPSEDQACEKMAVDFYFTLSQTDNVAASYRTAVMGLMEQKPLQPIYWAPFIHFGA